MKRERESPRTNLKAEVATFIGREAELEGVDGRFEAGARLVTLIGLGGIGKTRFACRFAAVSLDQWASHGGGGAWFIDLTVASSAADVLASIAGAIGVQPTGRDDVERAVSLGQALAKRKRILLVLDNFEGVVSHAEDTLGVLLREAPLARFLVTSRVPLALVGEERWPLEPLALPTHGDSECESAAAQLFVKRAREVRPQFNPDEVEFRAVREIVTRLDGIPLAIELAAARMSVLSADDLLRRLGRSLDVLVRPNADGRHKSMRAAIEDTFQQLGTAARQCLQAVSLFRGGFTLSAAEAILGGELVALTALETLVAHCLVRTGPSSQVRFYLYEAIREFAEERFASADGRAAIIARFIVYFRSTAAAPTDVDNLVHAHELATSTGDWPSALTLANKLTPLLAARGLFQSALRLLDAGLEHASGPGATPALLVEARLHRATTHRDLGDIGSARRDLEAAAALAGEVSALPKRLASLLSLRLAEVVETEGNTQSAREHLRTAANLLENEHEPLLRADIHRRLGHAARREGDLRRAGDEISRAVALYRAEADLEGLSFALYESGVVSLFAGEDDRVLAAFTEGLEHARVHGGRLAEGAIHSGLGVFHQERADLDRALEHHLEAVSIFRALGNRHREASALYYLGATYLERRQFTDAEPIFRASLALFSSVGAPRYEVLNHGMLATLRARAADDADARSHAAKAEEALALCASEGAMRATLDIHRLTLAALLDPASLEDLVVRATQRADAFPGDDTRLALRVLAILSSHREPSPTLALIVRRGAVAFRLPGADADIHLARREPLKRILLALGARRLSAPGAGLDKDELLAAGWPGERMTADAAQNRVHVALATLRKLGLRAHLVTGEDGYSLSSRTRVILE